MKKSQDRKAEVTINLSAYDYMDTMSMEGWQWEFIRRNAQYEKLYCEVKDIFSKHNNGELFRDIPKRKSAKIYKLLWKVEKQFFITPFYNHNDYGDCIPNPNFSYNKLPDSMKPFIRHQETLPTVIGLSEEDLEKRIKGKIKEGYLDTKFIEQLLSMDKELAYQKIVHCLLSPTLSRNVLYIGISLDASKDKVKEDMERLLNKHIRPKIDKGDAKRRLDKFKSYLIVWDERRLRKPFKQIAKGLNTKEPACKKMFYKTYELIYGKKYNPADYKKPKIKKEYLKRECNTCKEKPTCKDLCPDVIKFVNQDTKPYQRELTSKYV